MAPAAKPSIEFIIFRFTALVEKQVPHLQQLCPR